MLHVVGKVKQRIENSPRESTSTHLAPFFAMRAHTTAVAGKRLTGERT